MIKPNLWNNDMIIEKQNKFELNLIILKLCRNVSSGMEKKFDRNFSQFFRMLNIGSVVCGWFYRRWKCSSSCLGQSINLKWEELSEEIEKDYYGNEWPKNEEISYSLRTWRGRRVWRVGAELSDFLESVSFKRIEVFTAQIPVFWFHY